MDKLYKLEVIILITSLVVTSLPADALALRAVAYKNYCMKQDRTTQQSRPALISTQSRIKEDSWIKERPNIILQRTLEILKPVLLTLLFLPIALLLNHIFCEYIINSSDPLYILIDAPELEEEARLYFERVKDNFPTDIGYILNNIKNILDIGLTKSHLHYVPNEKLIEEISFKSYFYYFFVIPAMFLSLYVFRITKNKWLGAMAIIGIIYGPILNDFNKIKYHGVLNYILTASPGDIFVAITIICLNIILLKFIFYRKKELTTRKGNVKLLEKPSNPLIKKVKAGIGQTRDLIAKDLKYARPTNIASAATTPFKNIRFPKADLLTGSLQQKIFAVNAAA